MFSWITNKVCQKVKQELEGQLENHADGFRHALSDQLKVKQELEDQLRNVKATANFKFYIILPTMLVLIVFLFKSLRDLLLTNRQLQKLNRNLKQLSHNTHQCKICFQSFNGSDHRPAKINCNHVYFCEPCLTTIAGKFNQTGRCPICDDRFSKKDISPLCMSFV